jgi:hypothetical protein
MDYWDRVGAFPVDDAKADQFLGQVSQLQQERNALVAARYRESIDRAKAKYGEAWDEVEADYNRLNPNNPVVAGLNHSLRSAYDVGEAFMSASDTIRTLANPEEGWSQPQQPPFAQTRDARHRAYNMPSERRPMRYEDIEAGSDSYQYDKGRGEREERDVMNSVWDDFRK